MFLEDQALQAQAERHLQLAIQAALDIANHILAEDSAETPEDYASTFTLLGRIGVVEEGLAGRLRASVGLRNILVHAYLDVDPVLVWESMEHLSDLEEFASTVDAYLRR